MKRKFTKLVCLALCFILCENIMAQQASLVIDNQIPGMLSDMINKEDQKTVENLKIMGYINSTDINFIKTLNKMKTLDLTDVNIIKGGNQIYLYSERYSAGSSYPTYLSITENNVFYNSLFWSFHVDKIATPKALKEEKPGSYVRVNADTVILNSRATLNISSSESNYSSYGFPAYSNRIIEIGEGVDSVGLTDGYPSIGIEKLIIPSTLKKLKNWVRAKAVVSKIEHPETLNAEDFNMEEIKKRVDTLFIPQGTYNRYHNSIFKDIKVIIELNAPTSISLSATTMKLYVNDFEYLYASTIPSDVYYKELKWESSDESVAVVNKFGEVTAVAPGIAEITVSSVKNLDARVKCKVSVCEHATGIELKSTDEIVNIGEPLTLTANTLPLGTTDNEVTWTSSNEEIAIVDVNGKVTGVKPGYCTIKATTVDGGFEAMCNITVVQPAREIMLSKQKLSIMVNESETLTATVSPESTTNKTILWSSSNTNVATVDANGMVTAKKAGKCTITATVSSNPNVKATCNVTVIQPISGITLNKNTIEMSQVGEQNQLVATISPEDATDKSVTWSSSNNQVCTVSSTGLVTAAGAGSAIVTATTVDGGLTANCVVKVLQHVDGLNLNKTAMSLKVGESEKLQPTITPSNADNKKVVWTSSNDNVATVDAEGNVTAVKAGQITITATSEDNSEAKATCAVTVIQPVTGISLSESTYKLKAIGESIQLTVTVLPEDATNKKVNWNCPNNTVCVVSNGNVVAVGYGTAVVIATTEDGGFIATCTITVENSTGFVEVRDSNNEYYPTFDTMGRKVQKLKKGQLYIRQGKKFVFQ